MIMFLTGKDISALRHAMGMNLREFADSLGVAEATVSRWEANKRRPNYEMMERLSKLYDKHVKADKKAVAAK